MTSDQAWPIDRIARFAAFFSLVVFTLALGLFAYAGTYARYWADDYCYSGVVRQMGLLRGVVDWYSTSGNRVSAVFAVALSDLFGQVGIRFLPMAILALWAGAWLFFLWKLTGRLNWTPASTLWLGLLAVVLVFFAALLAPDRLQTLYWRMGTFHYTLPLPLLLVNLGLLVSFWRRPVRPGWAGPLSGGLALFAAGLSETFVALQTVLLLAMLAAALLFARHAWQRGSTPRLLAWPLAGSLGMMVLMLLSPGNAFRQAVLPPPANLFEIVPVSLRYGWDFIYQTLRGAPTPFLVYVLLVGLIALLAYRDRASRLSVREALVGVFVSLLAVYALVVCSFAPSAYAGLQYPAGRAQMPAAFVLLAGLGATAFFAADLLRRAFPLQRKAWAGYAAVALLLAASLYPFRAATVVNRDLAQLSVRAGRWDARNAQILTAAADGQQDIQVRQIDVVQGLEDIGPDADYWVNRCAALYYGVRSITAKP